MPKKRFSAEQIVVLLRQIEVAMGAGKSTQIACREPSPRNCEQPIEFKNKKAPNKGAFANQMSCVSGMV